LPWKINQYLTFSWNINKNLSQLKIEGATYLWRWAKHLTPQYLGVIRLKY
jgi:hypothetical protein